MLSPPFSELVDLSAIKIVSPFTLLVKLNDKKKSGNFSVCFVFFCWGIIEKEKEI